MQATGGVRTKSGKPAGPPPDLVEVAFADEVPAEDGGRKAVDIPGSQQPLMLMRYKNKIIGSAAQCTRCKFPLVGADYADNALTWCVQICCVLCSFYACCQIHVAPECSRSFSFSSSLWNVRDDATHCRGTVRRCWVTRLIICYHVIAFGKTTARSAELCSSYPTARLWSRRARFCRGSFRRRLLHGCLSLPLSSRAERS